MKKILLSFLLLSLPVLLLGCQNASKLEDNISEITKTYFIAETQGAKASISVGEREEDYVIDGKHTKNVDFSLIAIKFDELLPNNQITVNFTVNDVVSEVILDLNPANHYYMTDLGYPLDEEDNIVIYYNNFALNFKNQSKTFGVDFNQALSLAKEELDGKLDDFYNNKNFEGECYLKILTEQEGEDGNLFWVFTVVGRDGNKNNVVLSVDDGRIIVSD